MFKADSHNQFQIPKSVILIFVEHILKVILKVVISKLLLSKL